MHFAAGHDSDARLPQRHRGFAGGGGRRLPPPQDDRVRAVSRVVDVATARGVAQGRRPWTAVRVATHGPQRPLGFRVRGHVRARRGRAPRRRRRRRVAGRRRRGRPRGRALRRRRRLGAGPPQLLLSRRSLLKLQPRRQRRQVPADRHLNLLLLLGVFLNLYIFAALLTVPTSCLLLFFSNSDICPPRVINQLQGWPRHYSITTDCCNSRLYFFPK